jgi:hypothetical protein
MHIILDANIYAADYRMTGAAFQSLFEYMRRTASNLVLPRVVREEVVVGYGRQLKREARLFEEAWNRYRRVDLSDDAQRHFFKPDIGRAKVNLRRKLMKPMDNVAPIYVPEITGAFVQEAFMRGIHRTRPANDAGEELRDVILWLWVLDYANNVDAVTFMSDDGGFWAADGVHPDIDRDLQTKNGKMHIYRTIPDFLKAHAPAPIDMTADWFQQHFEIQRIERELIDRALKELQRALPRDILQALSIERHELKTGKVYELSPDSEFAELQLRLVLKFVLIPGPPAPYLQNVNYAFASAFGTSGFAPGVFGSPGVFSPGVFAPVPFGGKGDVGGSLNEPAPVPRDLRCDAEAHVSVRIKNGETTEVSVGKLTIDRGKLYGDLYRKPE